MYTAHILVIALSPFLTEFSRMAVSAKLAVQKSMIKFIQWTVFNPLCADTKSLKILLKSRKGKNASGTSQPLGMLEGKRDNNIHSNDKCHDDHESLEY